MLRSLMIWGLWFLVQGSIDAVQSRVRADAIDALVEAKMKERKIPGLALAVIEDGREVKVRGYGLANVELDVPVTERTIFQSGSIGKQFTATLVMMLVEDGKIHLDDHISKYFEKAPEMWKDITVQHLLTHTAGISNKLYEKINMRKDYSDSELVEQIRAIPLEFQPGEKWEYSNPGYLLLGILVKNATGRFYGDLLRERVFQPLGMATTRIISEADIIPNRASGYRLVNDGLKNQEWVSPTLNTTADGSLYLTVRDLVAWDRALAAGKPLRPESFARMYTPVKLRSGKTQPYGFGWGLEQVNGHKLIEHGGAWQGFTTHIARYVDDKLTVIVLTNSAHSHPSEIAHQVAGVHRPALRPKERTPIQVDPGVLDAYVGAYSLSAEVKIEITRDGKRLMGQVKGQPRTELFPEAPDHFFLKEVDVQVRFIRDGKGAVEKLILHQNGEYEAKRVK